MSRGLGKLQRDILGLLRGEIPAKVYGSMFTGAITRELLDEIRERGHLQALDNKAAASAIRRACDGLVRRGLIDGEWTNDCDAIHLKTITWKSRSINSLALAEQP